MFLQRYRYDYCLYHDHRWNVLRNRDVLPSLCSLTSSRLRTDRSFSVFGFSTSVYWLKFNICKSQPGTEKTVLEINYPLLDSLRLYGVKGGTLAFDVLTGDNIPFSERPVNHRNFIFFLPDTQNNDLSVYLRVQSESAVQVPLKLYSLTGYFIHNQRSFIAQGVYFGIILAMILYNAFLFFTLREWPYLLYVFFTISYFYFQSVLQGFFQQFLCNSVWWQNHSLLLFGFFTILFANLFSNSFLKLSKKNPLISKILFGIGFLSILAAALVSILPYRYMVKVMLALGVTSSVLILIAGFIRGWSGHLPARIFTIAWSTLLISFILAAFNKFGLLPRTFWSGNIMQIGGVLEVVLLSIVLGERINAEKQQRIHVEQRFSTSLEDQVKARTLELNQTMKQLEITNRTLESEQEKLEFALREIGKNHKELKKTYHSLQEAQTQLLQAEKMQSVGRLAAGVAHEINTPIQFVGDNARFILDSMLDIEKLMIAHELVIETAENGVIAPDLIEDAKAFAEEIDLDYLRKEIPQAIQQSIEGLDKVADIVRALKEFSHPGRNEKSLINLNKAIESTVTVCRNEWRYHAELELDLDPDLAEVSCVAGEINQTILNIIVNAAHAVKSDTKTDSKGLIKISTHIQGAYVVVRISDNGIGIPEEILTKVFEPFYTTKAVGEGTGQGLAIAYSTIVDKHGGTIEVKSERGKGTIFIISLPIMLEKQTAILRKGQENT